MSMRIGVDAGGTFTDFVVIADGEIRRFKLRSNPSDPASVILEGLRQAGMDRRTEVVHGSTVATNALLERKGARTALVTTRGFEDVIEIGRQNRAGLYSLTPRKVRPIIPAELRFGLEERTFYDGTVAIDPSPESLRRMARQLERAGVEAVAICFLHSYGNAQNERKAAQALAGLQTFVCASHEVCPEFREYERTSTTVLNAYVGPLMDRYLAALEKGVAGKLSIMQSNGGLLAPSEARHHAVRTILSGPAGGVVGAVRTAAQAGFTQVLGFDMGGTSTDVSLAVGEPKLSLEASVDGLPVRVPLLDIHTVGAGGGSLARIDVGGLLRVGPESAGADPGPACYGKGDQPTVTDAHVVLGRIPADRFLGGAMPLDTSRAEAAVAKIADALQIPLLEAAERIIRVANANMERAIRVISVERGHDPRDFTLVAFGGCGGLHACEIASELGIRRVFVPAEAGVLSALGMLLADRVRDYSAGALGVANPEKLFRELEARARKQMPGARGEVQYVRSCDVRYAGQSFEINVPEPAAFHDAHRKLYGYADPAKRLELVTVRVRAVIPVEAPPAGPKTMPRRRAGNPSTTKLFASGKWTKALLLTRDDLTRTPIPGPALLTDSGSTTFIPKGWSIFGDPRQNAILTR
jgi:N-methylhydantoinase A